jgi:hypothetical protein
MADIVGASNGYQTTVHDEEQNFSVSTIEPRRARDAAQIWKYATLGMTVVAAVFMISTIALASKDDGESNNYYSSPSTNLLSADADRCKNVMDWNFFNAQVTENNLGGAGPDSGAKEIRYSGVGNGMDLVLTTDAKYEVNPKVKEYEIDGDTVMGDGALNNGINGKFGQVNVKGDTDVKLTFTLMEEGTNLPADIAEDQTVFFSVYDLDTNGPKGYEFIEFTTPVDSHFSTPGSSANIKGTDAKLSATATRQGNDLDNPDDPLKMTQLQKDSAIWITYKGRNTWGMTFGEKGNAKGKGGRNLLFAGRAEGDCPPGPVAPPPGACDAQTQGIEGVIAGGGRVCCEDKCGGSAWGGPDRWYKTPYACGGPSCDKGADGKRDPYRYQNCCVGKPVSGGTKKSTIDAPYGIVSQGRFCSHGLSGGLGNDGPPCVNKLTKV